MIYLGADHNGYKLKEYIKDLLSKANTKFVDLGNHKLEKADDYPDYAKLVATKVSASVTNRGILICGSGQGMAMAANKLPRVRAALVWDVNSTRQSRRDNDSNILCLSSWHVSEDMVKKIVTTWLTTDFSGMARHKRRIKKISA